MAAIALLHGPEKQPLKLGFRLSEAAFFGPFAYHGIIPRGLLRRIGEVAPEAVDEWDVVAPVLEDLLTGRLSLRDVNPASPAVRRLCRWYRAARKEAVLSLRDSTAAAVAFAERAVAEACGRSGPGPEVELWLAKEGHTASIWRLRIHRNGRDLRPPLCLNVARDRRAAVELRRTADLLAQAHRRDPGHVVAVHGVDEVVLPERPRRRAVVAAADWLEGGRELHLLAGGRDRTMGRFFAVEWFAMSPAGSGPGPQHVMGRWLGEAEAETVWREHVSFAARHARFRAGHRVLPLPIEINEGDLVLLPGVHTAVVGASAVDEPCDLGRWVLDLLLAGTRGPVGRLVWGQPEAALAVVGRELAARRDEVPDLGACVVAAASSWERESRHDLPEHLADRMDRLLSPRAHERRPQ